MTKIVALSDVHGLYDSKELTDWFNKHPADILLYAGDIQRNNEDYGAGFLAWIDSLPCKHKVLVFGNHDGNHERTLVEAMKYDNINFLTNESVVINGIKIFGSPNTLPIGQWFFMSTESQLEEIYKTIPNDTNILLTHQPAFKILDLALYGEHVGSISLLNRINQLKRLKFHICGHIHEAHGKAEVGKVKFYNVSVVNEHYELVHEPVLINYPLWD